MISCVMIAGLFYLAGTDYNGDGYLVSLFSVESVRATEQDVLGVTTQIRLTSGDIIVEDLELIDVAIGMEECTQAFFDQ